MNFAKDLHHESGLLHLTTYLAEVISVIKMRITLVALVVDSDKLNIPHVGIDFDHVSDNDVSGDQFEHLDLIVCLEVRDILCDSTNDFEMGVERLFKEVELDVDVDSA